MGANAVTTVYDFTAGQVLTAAQMDNVNCGIPVFATTTTRDAAFGSTGEKTLAEGQFAYIEATNTTQYYDGAAWQELGGGTWAAWTPTYTNLTLGNGTVVARYAQVGKIVTAYYKLTYGSTTSITGSIPTITLPITGTSNQTDVYIGVGQFLDVGNYAYDMRVKYLSTTTFGIFPVNAQLNWANMNDLTGSQPTTGGTNDILAVSFTYEAA